MSRHDITRNRELSRREAFAEYEHRTKGTMYAGLQRRTVNGSVAPANNRVDATFLLESLTKDVVWGAIAMAMGVSQHIYILTATAREAEECPSLQSPASYHHDTLTGPISPDSSRQNGRMFTSGRERRHVRPPLP